MHETFTKIFDQETVAKIVLQEKDYQASPLYLTTIQSEIKWYMRAILLDWLIEVSNEFSLKRETYYISQSLIDKYLSIRSVRKNRL